MTFSKAQQEFKIRYYLWAISEFEREIKESFPGLQLFRAGAAWGLLQFMRRLDSAQQRTLASGLLKRFHPEAVKALGEVLSGEEESLMRQRNRFSHQMADAVLGREEVIPKFITKRKLLKELAKRFQEAFAGRCVEKDRELTGDPNLRFDAKCGGGWIISTHFWFGRGESLIMYSHAISSEALVEQRGAGEPYMGPLVMDCLMSFCSWLGICSQTEWEHLSNEEEVNRACDAVIKLSGHFFDVAPKLLKGLEFEKITSYA